MALNRKDFIKKACISGACFCGFASVSSFTSKKNEVKSENTDQDDQNTLTKEWLTNLLSSLDHELDKESARKIIKQLSIVHYNHLKMDEILVPYLGNLEKFILFIEKEWGWKVYYDTSTQTLIADENKNYCVCPIIDFKKEVDTSAICYCSEGFAEKMFSVVSGKSTTATVISSIRKGDDRCVYKIVFTD